MDGLSAKRLSPVLNGVENGELIPVKCRSRKLIVASRTWLLDPSSL